jgi:hypothetical protein
VTFGFVEAGEIIGILFCWQIGAASREREDATSPMIATGLSPGNHPTNDCGSLAGL